MRQLGLLLVIIDVVTLDDMFFRGLSWLAGAQYNAHVEIFQLFTNITSQIQSGGIALHHHIQQHQGNIIAALQHQPRLLGAIATDK